eukprot:1394538-Amorphochlora_amoeboformis.AAC.2
MRTLSNTFSLPRSSARFFEAPVGGKHVAEQRCWIFFLSLASLHHLEDCAFGGVFSFLRPSNAIEAVRAPVQKTVKDS